MVYRQKGKKGWTSKLILASLLMINIFLLASLVLHWYTARGMKDNFNDFSQQIKKELKNFSQIVNQAEEELQNIQKEIKGLTKTIEELNAIERELKNIATSLAKLNKTGEELKETGENIKGSLDDLGEIKEKIAELAKLEIPLSELEKTVGQEGGKIAKELKEKIGGLIYNLNELKKIICPTCFNWNFKINSFTLSNNIIEERKWKRIFADEKLVISGKIVTVKYSQPQSWSLFGNGTFDREEKDPKKDVTFNKKEEIGNWKDKEEPKSDGEEREEFILQATYCKDCERKLDLNNFSIKELRTIWED
ncbi:protein of unknown function [endosymbiont DhMRE of Dentiscutata heterogama]|uniref:hypothetical protein n=1 Tax=endosymbiont DhMRE of Dentiscutata heterogama TaxID=1609546 RepID=UPI000629D857|nr:hypothetical protein [endosymbiont DhMRE of Dentiscutata heterogama]CFW92871.1 protein of unknown function [endosymbiont DhMRE of Dentiscutata heterogama]